MSSSRTLSRKRRTSFTCIKPRFGPSIIVLYIAVSVEQYCDITQVNALPENEGILEIASLNPVRSTAEIIVLSHARAALGQKAEAGRILATLDNRPSAVTIDLRQALVQR